MLDSVNFTALPENNEPFQVLIDESYLTLIRDMGIYVCQVHLPCNFGDLAFELGRLGFAVSDAYGEGGVLDVKLRKLGDIPLGDEACYNNQDIATRAVAMSKEEIYA